MGEKIKEFRKEYSKIRHIECAAFNGEKVFFNRHGMTHLTKKGRVPRNDKDILRRFFLFQFVHSILRNEKIVYEYRENSTNTVVARFWTIKRKINGRIVKVLIRQFNDGTKHFFSVMDKS